MQSICIICGQPEEIAEHPRGKILVHTVDSTFSDFHNFSDLSVLDSQQASEMHWGGGVEGGVVGDGKFFKCKSL